MRPESKYPIRRKTLAMLSQRELATVLGPGPVRLKRMHSVKSRPNRGRAAFNAYCDLVGTSAADRNEEYTVTDQIVDLLHFARRKGWDAELIMDSVRMHLDAETLESCPKCGKQVQRENALEDEGEGDEASRTFYYCSSECRDTH
jgi:hypothetical protein